MVQRALVNFKDYNGYKDVKFVMRPNEVEWRKSLTKDVEGIELIDLVDVKKNQFQWNNVLYVVHSDWSVSPQKP